MASESGLSGRRPTLADVAARAGVSVPLVSIVMRDAPGASAATRERVRLIEALVASHAGLAADLRVMFAPLRLEDIPPQRPPPPPSQHPPSLQPPSSRSEIPIKSVRPPPPPPPLRKSSTLPPPGAVPPPANPPSPPCVSKKLSRLFESRELVLGR